MPSYVIYRPLSKLVKDNSILPRQVSVPQVPCIRHNSPSILVNNPRSDSFVPRAVSRDFEPDPLEDKKPDADLFNPIHPKDYPDDYEKQETPGENDHPSPKTDISEYYRNGTLLNDSKNYPINIEAGDKDPFEKTILPEKCKPSDILKLHLQMHSSKSRIYNDGLNEQEITELTPHVNFKKLLEEAWKKDEELKRTTAKPQNRELTTEEHIALETPGKDDIPKPPTGITEESDDEKRNEEICQAKWVLKRAKPIEPGSERDLLANTKIPDKLSRSALEGIVKETRPTADKIYKGEIKQLTPEEHKTLEDLSEGDIPKPKTPIPSELHYNLIHRTPGKYGKYTNDLRSDISSGKFDPFKDTELPAPNQGCSKSLLEQIQDEARLNKRKIYQGKIESEKKESDLKISGEDLKKLKGQGSIIEEELKDQKAEIKESNKINAQVAALLKEDKPKNNFSDYQNMLNLISKTDKTDILENVVKAAPRLKDEVKIAKVLNKAAEKSNRNTELLENILSSARFLKGRQDLIADLLVNVANNSQGNKQILEAIPLQEFKITNPDLRNQVELAISENSKFSKQDS